MEEKNEQQLRIEDAVRRIIREETKSSDYVLTHLSDQVLQKVIGQMKVLGTIVAIPLVVFGALGAKSVWDIVQLKDQLESQARSTEQYIQAVQTKALNLDNQLDEYEKRTGAAFKEVAKLVEESEAREKAAADLADLNRKYENKP